MYKLQPPKEKQFRPYYIQTLSIKLECKLDHTYVSAHFSIECAIDTEKYICRRKSNKFSFIKTRWKAYKEEMDSLYDIFLMSRLQDSIAKR